MEFFKQMEESVKRRRLDATGRLRQQSRHLTEASYAVGLRTDSRKSRTQSEELW